MADVEELETPNKELQLDAPEHRFDDDDDEDEILPDEQQQPQPQSDSAKSPVQSENDDDGDDNNAVPSPQMPAQQNQPDEIVERDRNGVRRVNDIPEFTRRFKTIILDSASGSSEAKAFLQRVLKEGARAVADILAIVVSPAVTRDSAKTAAELLTQRTVLANNPESSVHEICEALEATSRLAEPVLVTSRKCRAHFQNFWMHVAADSSDDILYDTDCFDTLLNWLEAMATAKLSILRHAACLAAYSIVDGLISSAVKLRAKLKVLQRQLKAEKTKCEKKKKKGAQVEWSDRYKSLDNQEKHASANTGELVELADKVFTGVFVLKYRDVAPEIRVASVEFLGKWIMRYPDHYLDDTHTKYIGWLLSDKDAGVRRACLAALGEMLKEPDCLPALELFLRRFLARIVEMCHDRDNDVSVRALRVCALLVPYDILDQEATDKLCGLLYEESNAAVRKAAGEFVVAFITDPEDEAPTPKKRIGGRSKKKTVLNEGIPGLDVAMELLRELVDVCVKDGAPVPNAALVLDAVWEVMPASRSWQAYAKLLQDNGKEAMEEDHKSLLAELLLAAAKQVAVEEPRPKKGGKKNMAESCMDGLARIFTPLIPKFLVQYRGSSRILAALVQIPKHFFDVHFTESSSKKHFLQLLSRLVEAISKYTGSKDVLDAALGTFKTLLNDSHPLSMLANQSLAKASKEAAKELRVLVASGISDQDAVAVGAAVLKSRVISNLKALPEGATEDVMSVLDTVLEKRLPVQFNTDVVTDACHVAVRQWLWDMLRAANMYGSRKDENEDDGEEENDEEYDAEQNEVILKLQTSLEGIQRRLAKFAEYPYNLRVRVASAQSICSMLSVNANMKLKFRRRDDNVEKEDAEMKDGDDNEEQPISFKELSFAAVQECVLDVIVEQWSLPLRHPKVTSRYENLPAKEARVPEHEVRALYTALTQVCLTSDVPERFLHLPFLGFLLNRGQGSQPVESVCKVFLSRKMQVKHEVHGLVIDTVKCVADMSSSQRERKHQVVSLLARALMEAVPKKNNNDLFSDVLKSLLMDCGSALESRSDASVPVSILGKVNAFFAPRLDIDTASSLLVDCREMKEKIKSSSEFDEEERNQLGLLIFPVVQLLETVSSGEEAVIPTPLKKIRIPKPASRGRPRGKAHVDERSFAGPKVTVNRESLRRSKRKRKVVKMDLFEESGSEEEEEEEEIDDEVEDVPSPNSMESKDVEEDEEEEEEGEEEEEVVDVPMRTPPRPKRKSKRKDSDEDLYGDEDEVMPTPRSRSERMSARKEAAGESSDKEAEENDEEEGNEELEPLAPHNSKEVKSDSDDVEEAAPPRRSRRKSGAQKTDDNDGVEVEAKLTPARRRSARNRNGKKSSTDDDEAKGEEKIPTRSARKKSLSNASKKDSVEEAEAKPRRSTRKSRSTSDSDGKESEGGEVKSAPVTRSQRRAASRGSSTSNDEQAAPVTRSQKKRRRKSSTGSGKISVDGKLDSEDELNFEMEDEQGMEMEGVDEVEEEEAETKSKSKSKGGTRKDVQGSLDSSKKNDDDDPSKNENDRDAPTSKETEVVENDEGEEDDLFEETVKTDGQVPAKGANGTGTKRKVRGDADDIDELPDTPVLRRKKQKRW